MSLIAADIHAKLQHTHAHAQTHTHNHSHFRQKGRESINKTATTFEERKKKLYLLTRTEGPSDLGAKV